MSLRSILVRVLLVVSLLLGGALAGCDCNYLAGENKNNNAGDGTQGRARDGSGDDASVPRPETSALERQVSEPLPEATLEPLPETPSVEKAVEPEPPCESGRREGCQSEQPGLCGPGIRECIEGKWGKCVPLQKPTPERCNNQDDDCDGRVDNQANSARPMTRTCYNQGPGCTGTPNAIRCLGICQPGQQACVKGQWGACQNSMTPKPEICNDGLDNDCDGQLDETCECALGQTQPCWPGDLSQCPQGLPCKGICKRGVQGCTPQRTWGRCVGAVQAKEEVCNGLDDDCDGRIDNQPGRGLPLEQACYSGPANTRNVGECKDGTQQCLNGKWGSCQNDTLPSPEKYCGANPLKDFNCDGIPNNFRDLGKPCVDPKRKGICRPGTWQCLQGVIACGANELPRFETCNNLDDDCDGSIDEAVIRECPYSGPPNTKDVGICKAGKQSCRAGQWGQCSGEVLPQKETCNLIDDNCNGTLDEFVPLQRVGPATIYSGRGSPAHVYLTATDTGYVLGWSENQSQRVKIALVKPDGSKQGKDIVITQGNEFGNIHGLTYTGNQIAVSWDTDKNATAGDALMLLLDKNGKRLLGPKMIQKGGRMVNPQVVNGPGFLGLLWSDFLNNKLFVQTYDLKLQPLSTKPHSFTLSTRNSPYSGLSFSGDRLGVVWTTFANKLKVGVFDRLNNKIAEAEIPNAGRFPSNATIAGDATGYLVVWSDQTTGQLFGQRIDRNAKPVGTPQTIVASGARTPIMRATTYGGLVAWIQTKNGSKGVSVAWIDNTGKLLATPSWFAVPNIIDYLALAWKDIAKGRGRGAIAWLDQANVIRVAPLGCK